MKVTLGNQTFPTKKAAEEFVRAKLRNFDSEDPIWIELLKRHPEREQKIGPGISEFFVTRNPLNRKGLQLNIRRVDGTTVDISWLTCIDATPMSHERRLKDAMRRAITDQIQGFKAERYKGSAICSLCNQRVSERSYVHVDHFSPSFLELAEEFLMFAPYIPKIFDDCPATHSAVFKTEDSAFAKGWREFHHERASLRILCKNCNLTRSKPRW